ncbi:polysaccharide lyase family 4, domain III-domain-containing protein [Tricharina praecox]|uniref:polysaccharide lyase family 4, domain III-domain-containing protein n=1 Tax=Tricharina praecox TaxID=43433 RepID=UPI00221F1830|nr:polysaccharide lyase family 4, domain III-domain-containing protein [Tricharina praecox]KAI5856370.1 polysaccharide lyase family 4, domain III-domain-containing protein [Tricharina praecox]
MSNSTSLPIMKVLFPLLWLSAVVSAAAPTLVVHNNGTNGEFSTTISNDVISMHVGRQYGTKLMYKGEDLVKNATGAYGSYGSYYDLNYTSVTITSRTSRMLDVAYTSKEGDIHFVLFTGLSGFYSYFVNTALGVQGEFRTLYRLTPELFPNGRTYLKDAPLPLFETILTSPSVQDETWQAPDGTYITKYDNSFFVRQSDFYGVYGPTVGAWMINPGKDYLNGDQLKQELSVHRESRTNDAVLLNMLHGTHFQGAFSDVIPVGKVFGPWLVYINDGSVADAAKVAREEEKKWPYSWLKDEKYLSRGTVEGRLVLADGTPAAGAAIFLGDEGRTIAQGTTFQYTTNASASGYFSIPNVRTEKQYTLQAWGNGGKLAGVTTVFSKSNITLSAGKRRNLGTLKWTPQPRKSLWRIGAFDRKATGFKLGGLPYTHGLVDGCPGNLTFTIGVSSEQEDWCFGKSAAGTWSVLFSANTVAANASSVLTVSLAGYSGSGTRIGGVGSSLEISVNGVNVGDNATPLGGNDPGLYRSATSAGEWRYFEWALPAGALKQGDNVVDFTIVTATRWRGVMWDAVMLEQS